MNQKDGNSLRSFDDAVFKRKTLKVAQLLKAGESKRFKKMLVAKMFKEDEQGLRPIPPERKAILSWNYR